MTAGGEREQTDDRREATADGHDASGVDEASDADVDEVPQDVRESVDDGVIAEIEADVPDWDDAYLDRVSDRLMFNYDLEKNERVREETWDLFGRMRIESQKQFLHRSINFANHHMDEYLLARRVSRVETVDLDRLVDLADDLADEWIVKDEEHQGTEFTFVLVAPDIPAEVRRMVESFTQRTLLKFGYYGHYEVNLVVVAPEREEIAVSPNADVGRAFALWQEPGAEPSPKGLLARLTSALKR